MKYIADFLGPSGFGAYEIDWSKPEPSIERVSKSPELLLIPGFVDVHCHGAFGIDFMTASTTDMTTLCARLAEHGYESFLPTTVTASCKAVLAAVNQLPDNPMIGGFHLEGPFISPEYPGAQPENAIALPPMIASEWDEVINHPKLKIVTLAPELPGSLDIILKLANRGVRVGMGHTNATYDEARRAYEFGATHATHAFNAMRPFHHREAGVVGYMLDTPAMPAELIYDRLHVSKNATSLLLRTRGESEVVAISDSTMATGQAEGTRLDMWGHACVTGPGSVRLESNGALAGSAITLLDAFRNLAEDFGPEVAVRSCCLNPRKLLGWKGKARAYIEMSLDYKILNRRVRERV